MEARSVMPALLLLLMFICLFVRLELEAFLLLLMNLLARERKLEFRGKLLLLPCFSTWMEESEGWFDSLFFANTMEYLWIRARWGLLGKKRGMKA